MPEGDSGTAGKVALELVRTAIAPRLEDVCDNLDRVQAVQLENAAKVAALERGHADLVKTCEDCRKRTEAALAGAQRDRPPLDAAAIVKWLPWVVAAIVSVAALALAVALCIHPELIPVVLRLGK
jgi:hypothetical protein